MMRFELRFILREQFSSLFPVSAANIEHRRSFRVYAGSNSSSMQSVSFSNSDLFFSNSAPNASKSETTTRGLFRYTIGSLSILDGEDTALRLIRHVFDVK